MASPPRPSVPAARLAVRVWESKWLRELTIDEATVHAELDGSEVRTLMKIGEEEVYPPAAFVNDIRICVTATSFGGVLWRQRKSQKVPKDPFFSKKK